MFSIATLAGPSGPRASIGVGENYYPLTDLIALPPEVGVLELLRNWPSSFRLLEVAAQAVLMGRLGKEVAVPAHDAHFLTPIRYPNKLFAVGANYSGHLKEMGLAVEKWASMPFFIRPPTTTLVGSGDTVRIPASTNQFDWECELTAIVGRRLSRASREEAAQAIAAYTIGLDLSCRDLIPAHNELQVDLLRGKAQDTMAPCGPHLVPAEFIRNIDDLRIQLWVNDQQMMDASTAEMLYKVDEMLSVISQYITLEPGDMVMTGSPSGSAAVHGNAWLQPGDRIRAEIAEIGRLEVSIRGSHDGN